METDSREKAFIHAISTAGVVYSVTRACTKGELSQCGCDDKVKSQDIKGKWEWGGCSDDIYYGAEFTRRFIDSVEDPNSGEGVMNLHNNEVGRRVSLFCQYGDIVRAVPLNCLTRNSVHCFCHIKFMAAYKSCS